MIITRTPYRISLFGGGTDYPSFYKRYGSLLVGFTIDQYVYVYVRKSLDLFDYKSRVAYSVIELVNSNAEIQNPGVKGTLEHFAIHDSLNIGIQGDLPARTGIGSSSSLVVGLSKALVDYLGEEQKTKSLARAAIKIERELLGEPGGIQDQIWAAYGGVNSITIDTGGDFQVRPIPVSVEFLSSLRDRMVLCHTGFSRNSFEVAASHDNDKTYGIKEKMLDVAFSGHNAFVRENIDDIGYELDRAWKYKRSISVGITNENIDFVYDRGIDSGAIGGKLLGAGGSGFMLFVLKDGLDKEEFSAKMGLTAVDFDYSYGGSELLLNEKENNLHRH